MINLTFNINDNFLASYLIANYKSDRLFESNKDKYEKDIISFQNLAWEKSKDLCMFIDGRWPSYKYVASEGANFKETGENIDNFLKSVCKTEEFGILRTQTENSEKKIQEEWERNYDTTSKYINDLGISTSGNYEILLVHPGIKSGNNIGNNRIIWSHKDPWPNYNTVYIWHEILHTVINNNDKTHALIELICDDEMRKLLNNIEYPPFEGHPYLKEVKEKIFPLWQSYLLSDKKDVSELISKIENLS
ncbi:hypothetical protein ACFL0C_01265 [Patescibacteria group bacterium]